MSGISWGFGAGKKGYLGKVQAKAESSTACPFCSFILTIYPTLNGMAPQDDAMFYEHLKKAHGLSQGIQP